MRILARLLALLLIPFAVQAQTVASGTTPVLWSNTSGSGTATLLYNASAPSLVGAQYLTYKQGAVPTGVTTYTSTFTSTAGSTGSLSVMCDDTCTVSLNKTQVGAVTTYNTVKTFPVTAIDGPNTLVIAVTNVAGNTGVAYFAALTPPVLTIKPPTVAAAYAITGSATLTILSDGTFTLSGTGLQAVKK